MCKFPADLRLGVSKVVLTGWVWPVELCNVVRGLLDWPRPGALRVAHELQAAQVGARCCMQPMPWTPVLRVALSPVYMPQTLHTLCWLQRCLCH